MGLINWKQVQDLVKTTVKRELRELRRIGVGVVARAVLRSAASGDGMQLAGAELRDGDSPEEVEIFEAYGFTSAALAGAEGVGLTVGGDASHRLLVCVGDRRHRPTDLEGGEVAVYRNAAGHRIILKSDGSTEVTTPQAGQTLVLKANGDVVVTPAAGGKIYLGQDGATKKVALADDVDARFAALQGAYDTHVHAGVTVGMGSTGTTPSVVGPLAPTGATRVNGV